MGGSLGCREPRVLPPPLFRRSGSGAGKTTLASSLLGKEPVTSGSIELDAVLPPGRGAAAAQTVVAPGLCLRPLLGFVPQVWTSSEGGGEKGHDAVAWGHAILKRLAPSLRLSLSAARHHEPRGYGAPGDRELGLHAPARGVEHPAQA